VVWSEDMLATQICAFTEHNEPQWRDELVV
jgi:hypothetical protein